MRVPICRSGYVCDLNNIGWIGRYSSSASTCSAPLFIFRLPPRILPAKELPHPLILRLRQRKADAQIQSYTWRCWGLPAATLTGSGGNVSGGGGVGNGGVGGGDSCRGCSDRMNDGTCALSTWQVRLSFYCRHCSRGCWFCYQLYLQLLLSSAVANARPVYQMRLTLGFARIVSC